MIGPHQRSVHGFLQRVERQKLDRDSDTARVLCGFHIMRHQRVQGLSLAFMKPPPLARQPVFERFLIECESCQQFTLIKRHRFLQRRRGCLVTALFKADHIDLHSLGIEIKRRAGV